MSSAIFGILCAILFTLYMIHQELQEMNNRARNNAGRAALTETGGGE